MLSARAKVVGCVDHHAVRGRHGGFPGRGRTRIQPAGAVVIPEGPAQAWLLADLDTGRILASRNPYESHAPASTIKVLLAIVVLDHLDRKTSHAPTRQYRGRVLLRGVQARPAVYDPSAAGGAADVRATMPRTCWPTCSADNVAVPTMNAKATAVGARNTRASSPSGLDAPGMGVITTPHDLAVIFRAALAYPMFNHIVRQPSAPFPGKTSSTRTSC